MKFRVFILALFFLAQSSGIGKEVMRLDAFFQHAAYHQITMGDSFWDFVVKHYTDDNHQHPENPQSHEQLPFHGNTIIVPSVVFFEAHLTFDFEHRIVANICTKSSYYYLNTYDYLYSEVLFTPPNFA